MPGQSIPMATLGVWILWLGWFGFNGASQLALGSYADANAVASIFANTTMANRRSYCSHGIKQVS